MIVKKAGEGSMEQKVDFRFQILDCRLVTGKTGSTD